jgi:hypothetical protein
MRRNSHWRMNEEEVTVKCAGGGGGAHRNRKSSWKSEGRINGWGNLEPFKGRGTRRDGVQGK